MLYIDINTQQSNIEKLFKSSSKQDLDDLARLIEQSIYKGNNSFIKKVLTMMKDDLKEFYERSKISEYLMEVIARIPPYTFGLLKNPKLAEDIIDMCIENTDLFGEEPELNKEVMQEVSGVSRFTMRAYLCRSINDYIIRYCGQLNKKCSYEKLEKAFLWVKTLMDLDGTLADKIEGFPKPNYYLRWFAVRPLIKLSYRDVRKNLNNYKTGLGDEIKQFAFDVLDCTKKEIIESNSNPEGLLNQICRPFDVIRDLDEKEAKKVLCFIKKFNIKESSHLFIYYALYRTNDAERIGKDFNSRDFKNLLKGICRGRTTEFNQSDKLKEKITRVIYERIKNKQTQVIEFDFDFFEKIKDYWILLFENIHKSMLFSLIQTLALVLGHDRVYYNEYKKYFFKLVEKITENIKEESDGNYGLHEKQVLQAISKYNPDDLVKILFLFLKKGNKATGWIPFDYEVKHHLIPEIKGQKDKISKKNIDKAQAELAKYNLSL